MDQTPPPPPQPAGVQAASQPPAAPSAPPTATPAKKEPGGGYSLGVKIVAILALLSGVALAFVPDPPRGEVELWVFSKDHRETYDQIIANDKAAAATDPDAILGGLDVIVLQQQGLVRRTLSAFWADTPVADLIEVERSAVSQFFSSPVANIGFVDLTERLKADGIMDIVNPPSFAPWTTRGRIFGLPHDVHPVMLVYNQEVYDAAGVDVDSIETWDDFRREMQKVTADTDGDGRPDRFGISMWTTHLDQIEALMLQAGGGSFLRDPETGADVIAVSSDANAMVLAHVVSWCVGPKRIAVDAPEFNPAGNKMKIDGRVASAIMPDWLAGGWKKDMPKLGGKLRLMPLPAWEPGGLRTTVWGGTSLMIPKSAPDFEKAWAYAKRLYLSPELAEALYRGNNIISPVRSLWSEPFYHEPDPFFGGQAVGSLFIEYADQVPGRTSSPYRGNALARIGNALLDLERYAKDNQVYEPAELQAKAKEFLLEAEARVQREIDRNVILKNEQW
ncbi:MAG: ABC transporter substrate-binding protein [Planctomycetota bacterium]